MIGTHVYHTFIMRLLLLYVCVLASDIDLPVVARFLSETMYGAAVPNGQRNELSRLQLIELRDGFGSHVGRSMYPSVLLIAEDNQEIIG